MASIHESLKSIFSTRPLNSRPNIQLLQDWPLTPTLSLILYENLTSVTPTLYAILPFVPFYLLGCAGNQVRFCLKCLGIWSQTICEPLWKMGFIIIAPSSDSCEMIYTKPTTLGIWWCSRNGSCDPWSSPASNFTRSPSNLSLSHCWVVFSYMSQIHSQPMSSVTPQLQSSIVSHMDYCNRTILFFHLEWLLKMQIWICHSSAWKFFNAFALPLDKVLIP